MQVLLEDHPPILMVPGVVHLEVRRQGLECIVYEMRLPIRLNGVYEVPVRDAVRSGVFVDHAKIELLELGLIEAELEFLTPADEFSVHDDAITVPVEALEYVARITHLMGELGEALLQ
jgi:pyridoxal biosynthesis lyase PdxS